MTPEDLIENVKALLIESQDNTIISHLLSKIDKLTERIDQLEARQSLINNSYRKRVMEE